MIISRSADEITAIRKAGQFTAQVLDELKTRVRPGIMTEELDRIAAKIITSQGGIPAFKGYRGFPANICTSLNETVVHGIPSNRILKEGDIISLDVGVKLGGYFADAAITVGVGKIKPMASKLIEVTEAALYRGLESARPGRRLGDISAAIQEYVESNGFNIVRAFVGHGIGTDLHEEPEIPNFGKRGTGPRLAKGMILAVEPMVNAGTYDVEILEDGWTAVTKDRSLSAHFEHTIAITDDGFDILTFNV